MNSDAPELSVVIPCYKVAHWLPAALESVIKQRGVRLEVIVVDDGSPDDIRSACKPFGSAVRYLRQENAGPAAARNAGIAEARGIFLHLLDGDDSVAPGMYACMLRALRRHPEWAAATCGSVFTSVDGAPTSCALLPPPTGNLFRDLAATCSLLPASVIIRKAILEQTGLYDLELPIAEDWDLMLRIARTGALFGCVNRIFYRYRVHGGSCSRSSLRGYEMCKVVLARARRPDPRVKDPDPRFAEGVPGEDIEERYALFAAKGLGKALGGDHLEEALALLGFYRKHLQGSAPDQEQLHALYWEAGMTREIVPPTHRETARACWPVLLALGNRIEKDAALEALLAEVAQAIFGTTFLEARRLRFERSAPYRLARWAWRLVRPYWPRR